MQIIACRVLPVGKEIRQCAKTLQISVEINTRPDFRIADFQ